MSTRLAKPAGLTCLAACMQADFHRHYLVLDLRDQKHFKQSHIMQSFCVRLSSNGKVLADYSKSEYVIRWTVDLWAGRYVYVVGALQLAHAARRACCTPMSICVCIWAAVRGPRAQQEQPGVGVPVQRGRRLCQVLKGRLRGKFRVLL